MSELAQETKNTQGTARCKSCQLVSTLSEIGFCQQCTEILEEINASDALALEGKFYTETKPKTTALAVHSVLAHYTRQCNVSFTLSDHAVMADQVLQPEAILPIISLEAIRIWQDISK